MEKEILKIEAELKAASEGRMAQDKLSEKIEAALKKAKTLDDYGKALLHLYNFINEDDRLLKNIMKTGLTEYVRIAQDIYRKENLL